MESTGIWASRTTLPRAGPRFSHAVFMVRMACTCSKTQMLQIGCCNEWHHDSNLFSDSQWPVSVCALQMMFQKFNASQLGETVKPAKSFHRVVPMRLEDKFYFCLCTSCLGATLLFFAFPSLGSAGACCFSNLMEDGQMVNQIAPGQGAIWYSLDMISCAPSN